MIERLVILFVISHICHRLAATDIIDKEATPEGYYAFVESPKAEPPIVRPPPYTHTPVDCGEDEDRSPHVTPNNLCGDLNKGNIPRNPLGQNVLGSSYPFELIRNMTLKYLSRTLPILRADPTLPKVAQFEVDPIPDNKLTTNENNNIDRVGRSAKHVNNEDYPTEESSENAKNSQRQSRKFCDGGGVFCELYKAMNGQLGTSGIPSPQIPLERRDDVSVPTRYEGPPTPCPAKVEYATPVFAKNYQGIWKYVVQIPYEGYFTQTVEVTRCLQSRCHYLDGGCLSSPRWSSLLVAEIFYPDTLRSNADISTPHRSNVAASQPPSVQDFQNYQQYLHKRAGLQPSPIDPSTTQRTPQCDGIDALGCFQVRLYYDWFLIPGSCKCWRPDYFNKYVKRKSNSEL
ncbi:hypothetical protein JTB14_007616 [Gonioctena quinquepunctata]|nr:hypothetical protein JTB14_007616 [Gonioctena quinquepunctata]